MNACSRGGVCAAVVLGLLALTGCGPEYTQRATQGITYYCPGAGHIDFGDLNVRKGLEAAGYDGEVATVVWTVSLNAAIDHSLRINAKLGALRLANFIKDYIEKYPGRPINLIGLSAGTGVAVWALEELPPDVQVDDVILLSSSLYHRYDLRKALTHVRGKIYNYYSTNDAVLAGPMKIFGTVDGVFFEDGAGSVGLHPPTGADRVVNIPWSPAFKRYGYHGGHLDSTSPDFVHYVLARHLAITSPEAPPKAAASASDAVLLDASGR